MVVHVCVSNSWVGLLVNMQIFWALKEVLDMQLPRRKKFHSTNNMRLSPSPSQHWVLYMLIMTSSLGLHTKQRSLHSCLAGLHEKRAAKKTMISLNKYDTIETFSFLLWPKTSMLVFHHEPAARWEMKILIRWLESKGLRSRDYDAAFWIQHWQDAEAARQLIFTSTNSLSSLLVAEILAFGGLSHGKESFLSLAGFSPALRLIHGSDGNKGEGVFFWCATADGSGSTFCWDWSLLRPRDWMLFPVLIAILPSKPRVTPKTQFWFSEDMPQWIRCIGGLSSIYSVSGGHWTSSIFIAWSLE